MLGYTREELEKLSFREITHPADLKDEEKLLSQLINGKITSYSIEKHYLHKSGAPFPVRVTSSQVRGSGSRGGYRISIIENIAQPARQAVGAADDEADGLCRALETASKPRRWSPREILNRFLPDRWANLNDALVCAIRECAAYHYDARLTGRRYKLGFRVARGQQSGNGNAIIPIRQLDET